MSADRERKVELDDSRRLLLVEGKDEENLFRAAMKRLPGFPDRMQVLSFGGVNQLRKRLMILTQDPKFKDLLWIGVVRDAERRDAEPGSAGGTAALDAAAAVADSLSAAGLPRPAGHAQFAGTNPRVGLFILPDGELPGMLEDLCVASVAQDPLMDCVKKFLECAKAEKAAIPNLAKATAHAYLTARAKKSKDVGIEVGLAADGEDGAWNLNHAVFQPLWDFLLDSQKIEEEASA